MGLPQLEFVLPWRFGNVLGAASRLAAKTARILFQSENVCKHGFQPTVPQKERGLSLLSHAGILGSPAMKYAA